MTGSEELKRRMFAERTSKTRAVDLEGIGQVTVRALNRAAVMEIRAATEGKGLAALERAILCYGLADPEMTADEVDAWYRIADNADVDALVRAISELSGMNEEAAKTATKAFPGPD